MTILLHYIMTLVFIFLLLLSKLPLSWLYRLSDLLAWVLEYVAKYRKDVVYQNLTKAFPQLNEQEIQAIAHDYYVHLGDLIVETIKMRSISKARLLKHCTFNNPEVLQQFNDGKVIIMMGHSGNWEWAGNATQLTFDFTMLPLYRRVKNLASDKFFKAIRSRFGAIPVRDKEAFQEISKADFPHAVAVIADQTPGKEKGWWTTFLNQPTPFFRGAEILAKRLEYPVVFAQVRKTGRGNYQIHLEEYPSTGQGKYEITLAFSQFLEREIQKQPFNWLWSHRRWKHAPHEGSTWMNAK